MARPGLTPGRDVRRIVAWAVSGFMLLQLGWILVMPPYWGIDEFDHAFRASSVAQGHLGPGVRTISQDLGRGGLIRVRADIARAARPACERLDYPRAFNCRPFRVLPGGEVLIASAASRYNPLFYAYVGTIARPWHGNAALYAMRVASAAASAALFAVAVWLTAGWARTRWPVAVLLLTALPTTVYSTTLAAPNGTEMMSGLVVWAALAHLLMSDRRSVGAYGALALGATLLVSLHSLGVLWLVLILAGLVVLVGPGRAARLLRPRGGLEWICFAVALAATAGEALWLVASRANDPTGVPASTTGSVWPDLPGQVVLWPLQAIGAFPFRDQPAPLVVYAMGIAILTTVATLGTRAARRTRRLLLTGVFVVVVSYAVPLVLTIATFPRFGYAWQGRYEMPFTVGLILLFGVALEKRGSDLRSSVALVGLGVFVGMHVISQVHVVDVNEGYSAFVRAAGWSAPPTVLLVALGLAAWFSWRRAVAIHPAELRSPDDVPSPAGPSPSLAASPIRGVEQTAPPGTVSR